MEENLILERGELQDLKCKYCGESLLYPPYVPACFQNPAGNLVLVYQTPKEAAYPRNYVNVHYTCKKGKCNYLSRKTSIALGCLDGWEEISDFLTPEFFCSFILNIKKGLRKGQATWKEDALEEIMSFIILIFLNTEKRAGLKRISIRQHKKWSQTLRAMLAGPRSKYQKHTHANRGLLESLMEWFYQNGLIKKSEDGKFILTKLNCE